MGLGSRMESNKPSTELTGDLFETEDCKITRLKKKGKKEKSLKNSQEYSEGDDKEFTLDAEREGMPLGEKYCQYFSFLA